MDSIWEVLRVVCWTIGIAAGALAWIEKRFRDIEREHNKLLLKLASAGVLRSGRDGE